MEEQRIRGGVRLGVERGRMPESSLMETTESLVEKLKLTTGGKLKNAAAAENEKYETAAKNDLIMYLKKDGFWNVVDDMIDAHFTISYTVDLQGRDKAYISIDSWRSGKSILLGATYTDESIRTNRRIVLEMYNKHIVSIQKKIEKGSVSKSMKKAFTIE